ncbi:DUF3592 domain-containing protein [Jidongwangia harbinensis]|uniref:DUF3592 domain-containing protein n=1 Tax=Jidongwangia harbinensis TaxID=2878561 RepID=UPI001CD929A4|nr:DUF3592 domain-containing protein [Jidongwangia harbinensis]MCA2217669.1 DUF3592 domain-containing protein [Jidongwangia harbinensis]
MRPVDVTASIVLVAVGVGFLALGLEIRSNQSPHTDGIVTTATTTSFHTERSANRRRTIWTTHYRPVYTFQTRTGETTTYTDPRTVREPPQLGRTAKLSYRTDKPATARVIRGWHGWTGFPIMFAAAGTLVLACVVYIVYLRFIRDRPGRNAR